MHLIRDENGKAVRWWDELDPADVGEHTSLAVAEIEDSHEQIQLDTTLENFEAEAKAEAGLSEGEPLGEVYVYDEGPAIAGQAFGMGRGRSEERPGRRVGQTRVRAYAPANPVTELRQEIGKNPNQSVSWKDMEAVAARFLGVGE